jgi:hypothetical protein
MAREWSELLLIGALILTLIFGVIVLFFPDLLSFF